MTLIVPVTSLTCFPFASLETAVPAKESINRATTSTKLTSLIHYFSSFSFSPLWLV
jgi:hypothetical protein